MGDSQEKEYQYATQGGYMYNRQLAKGGEMVVRARVRLKGVSYEVP